MVAWTNKCSSSVPPAEMTVEWLYTMLKYRGDQLDLLTAEVYELKKEAVEWKRREEKLQSKIEEATNKAEVAAGEAYEACREGEQMHRDMCEGMEKEGGDGAERVAIDEEEEQEMQKQKQRVSGRKLESGVAVPGLIANDTGRTRSKSNGKCLMSRGDGPSFEAIRRSFSSTALRPSSSAASTVDSVSSHSTTILTPTESVTSGVPAPITATPMFDALDKESPPNNTIPPFNGAPADRPPSTSAEATPTDLSSAISANITSGPAQIPTSVSGAANTPTSASSFRQPSIPAAATAVEGELGQHAASETIRTPATTYSLNRSCAEVIGLSVSGIIAFIAAAVVVATKKWITMVTFCVFVTLAVMSLLCILGRSAGLL